ncbi:MAG: hypothetical protein KatS3mg124_2393 [Porticoccaceae bacterium]|nr:MAG: hypothetical protein KatS3mg124_2393 [Porticoccaceae bacterium]
MRRALCYYLALPLAALLLAAAGFLAWCAATEPGSGFAVRQLLAASGVGSARAVSGTLWHGLELDGLRLSLADFGVAVDRARLRLRPAALLHGELHLAELALGTVALRQRSAAAPRPAAPWQWPTLAPPLVVVVERLAVERLTWAAAGESPRLLGGGELAAAASPFRIDLHHLRWRHPRGALELSGHLGTRYPYRHQLAFSWRATAGEQPLAGRGELRGNLEETALNHQLESPATLEVRGRLGLAPAPGAPRLERLHLSLEGRVEALVLGGAGGSVALEGGWQLAGRGADLNIRLAGALAATSAPPAAPLPPQAAPWLAPALPLDFSLAASLSGGTVAIQHLALVGDALELALSGEVGLDRGTPFHLETRLQKLELSPWLPDWPLAVSGRVGASGARAAQGWTLSLSLEELAGSLRARPVRAAGRIQLAPGRLAASALELAAGPNRLALDGELGERLDLRWRLAAPELAALHPDFRGALAGQGHLAGSADRPRLAAQLSGTGLRLADWAVAQLELAAELGEDQAVAASGALRNLRLPWGTFDRAALEVRGRLLDHRISLELDGPQLNLMGAARGGVAGPTWRGALETLALDSPWTGLWSLSAPASLEVGADAVRLEALCLAREEGRLCATARLAAGALAAEGRIEAVPLALLEPWLPRDTHLLGSASGQFSLSVEAARREGRLALATDDAALRRGELEEELSARLEARLANAQLAVGGALEVGSGRIGGEGTADLAGRRVAGHLELALPRLDGLALFLPALEQPQGALRGRLEVAGDWAAPALRGRVELADFGALLRPSGARLRDGSALLALAPDGRWTLEAQVYSGPGWARLAGSGRLEELREGTLALTLTGESFTAFDLPDLRLLANPAVTLALAGGQVHLAGTVEVPEGAVRLLDLPPSAVDASPDEVVEPPLPEPAGGAMPLSLDLQLHLGEAVRFSGYGLETRLAGRLRLVQEAGEPLTLRGRIRLEDGTFEAYGQRLAIERGQLSFQGDPASPAVNLVAVRALRDGRVGLRLSGRLGDFSSTVFSEPPLPPTDAFALLVTGKSPTALGREEADAVAGAAAALGLVGSDRLTTRLASQLGLDTLSLTGGERPGESALVMGKRLSPDVFVSYVRGLFGSTGALVLDYHLGRGLELRAESGEQQRLEIRYSIEH